MLPTTIITHSGGARLRIARLGSGPPLLLLHGYPDNLQIWSRLAPLLADRFEVIAFDWPGMGWSDPVRGGAAPSQMAKRLLAVLDTLGIERAGLVGCDMGGPPALVLAATHPERVSRLVVMNSLVIWDEPTSREIEILRRFGWNRLVLGWLPSAVFRRAELTFLPRGERLPPELRADLRGAFMRRDVRSFIIRMCAGYQGALPGLARIYPRVTAPTLILWGEGEKHFPVAHGTRLRAMLPDARLRIVPAGEHWMAWHQPGRVAGEIGSFMLGSDDAG